MAERFVEYLKGSFNRQLPPSIQSCLQGIKCKLLFIAIDKIAKEDNLKLCHIKQFHALKYYRKISRFFRSLSDLLSNGIPLI